jgi:ferredoxin
VQPEIRFQPGARTIRVEPGTSVLEAARAAGLPIASACGAKSLCGRCGVVVVAGASNLPPEDERERNVKLRNRIDENQRLACRLAVAGDVEVTATYW